MAKYTRAQFLKLGGKLAAALGVGSLPGCGVGSETAEGNAAADLVLINGHVYTVDEAQPLSEAFAVKNGRFLAVGSTDEIRNLASRDTEVIDAEGMTITPGFIDAHSHPASGGVHELVEVNLDLRSIPEIQNALRERAQNSPPGEWVLGFKYDDTKVREGRRITRKDLDEAVPEHPVRVLPTPQTLRSHLLTTPLFKMFRNLFDLPAKCRQMLRARVRHRQQTALHLHSMRENRSSPGSDPVQLGAGLASRESARVFPFWPIPLQLRSESAKSRPLSLTLRPQHSRQVFQLIVDVVRV